MKKQYVAPLVISVLLSAPVFGSEVDSFSGRVAPMPDSAEIINKKTNALVDDGLEIANKKGSCDEKELYKALRKELRIGFAGKFIRWVYTTDDFYKQQTRVKDSIYRDLNFADAKVLGGLLKWSNSRLASMVNIGGVRFGIDKFEHFLGSGFKYFNGHFLEGKSLEAVLGRGEKTERGILGGASTGVISFGDLSANFNGMRFWNHVLGKNADPLGDRFNHGPYVTCQNGAWVRVADIDWRNYIDPMFDEGRNCSAFHSAKIAKKIAKRVELLESQLGVPLLCRGTDPEVIGLRADKYAPVFEFISPREGDVLVVNYATDAN